MSLKALFGGAILVPLPSTFIDASQFRQIPDNQEVFVDMKTQQSLIFELLEVVEAQNEDIAKFHFQQLAEDNEAADSVIISVDKIQPELATPALPPDTTEVYILQGEQKIAKFNEKNAYNTVEIILAVVRLAAVSTDFVISLNVPVALATESSEQKSANDTSPLTNIESVNKEIKAILMGLQIKDWSLFC